MRLKTSKTTVEPLYVSVYDLYDTYTNTKEQRMAVLSLRVDDDLKKSLISEAVKENISLTEYVKKKLTDGLVDAHISKTQSNLSNSKAQIEKLTKISNEAIHNIECKIKHLGIETEKFNHVKQLKKMYWALISISIVFVLISIPILHFNTQYLKIFLN